MVYYLSIAGKKGSGKDLTANIAKDYLEDKGLKTVLYPFAKTLKGMVSSVFGVDPELFRTEAGKETLTSICWDTLPRHIRLKYSQENALPPAPFEKLPRSGCLTVRESLQIIGTDIFREMISPNVWADAPFSVEWEKKGVDAVLCPDLRFLNEINTTLLHGGKIVNITRDTELEDSHISENALNGYEFEFEYDNNGTIDELRDYVTAFLDRDFGSK